jgi:acetyl-CoA carboxylase biotin carboxyl carrier protein
MDLLRLKALVDLLAGSALTELDLTEDGHRVRLVKAVVLSGERAAPPQAAPTVATDDVVVSPLFGVCHLTPSPGAAPFVAVGQCVEVGQMLCTIEAMKVFHQVKADRAGCVEAVLVGTGQDVDAGTPLMRIVP